MPMSPTVSTCITQFSRLEQTCVADTLFNRFCETTAIPNRFRRVRLEDHPLFCDIPPESSSDLEAVDTTNQSSRIKRHPQPKWRNWQTRRIQNPVPVTGVRVRVPPSAPFRVLRFRRFGCEFGGAWFLVVLNRELRRGFGERSLQVSTRSTSMILVDFAEFEGSIPECVPPCRASTSCDRNSVCLTGWRPLNTTSGNACMVHHLD